MFNQKVLQSSKMAQEGCIGNKSGVAFYRAFVFSGFQKTRQKLTIFGIFNELLSTQNINVARFAYNFE